MYLLGYIPKDNRLYLGDKDLSVVSYSLQLSVLEYQTAVMRRDFETADRVLPAVPKEQRTRVAHFLEKQGFKAQALAVSADPEHRFELALQLGEMKLAYQLACEAQSEHKWKQLADLATTKCQFDLAQECLHKAQDFGGLLLLATASGEFEASCKTFVVPRLFNFFLRFKGNADMVKRLGDDAVGAGMNNVAFLTRFLSGDLNACLEILISTNRLPEAAFFARTYLPSQISRVVQLWKTSLGQVNAKASQSLADPAQYDNLFPGLMEALKTEQFLEQRQQRIPASAFTAVPSNSERHPVDEMHAAEQSGQFRYAAPAKDSPPEEEEEEDAAAAPVTIPSRSEFTSTVNTNSPAAPTAIPPAAAAAAAPVAQPKPLVNLLDDDEDDFQPATSAPYQHPAAGSRSQHEQDLELDLDNLELDDNVDTSEVNLDDDLLDD